jgi:hypothetical protein
MAMNQQGFHPEAPEFAKSRPDAYYAWLTSNGFPHQVAYDQTTSIFGAPKTPEQIRKEQAAAAQRSGLAQTGGMVGGAILANQAIQGFPALSGMFGGGSAAVAQPTLLGGSNILGGATGIGSGGTAATEAATTGATTAGTTTAGTSTLGSIGSVALPVAATAAVLSNAWETGMKDIVRGRGDRADWTNQGINILTGGVPNIALRLLGKRSIGAMMKSGKSGAQQLRDSFRGDLREAGVATKLDGSDHVTLADGSKFNIGLDGKTKYTNVGENIDKKTSRNAWDVDFSNPLAKLASDKIDPMIRSIYGADDAKKKFFPGQYTGILVNAVTSNAKNEQDVLANIDAVLGKSKFAQEAGVGVTPPPPPRPPKGEVIRVSPGMYMNDKGHIQPAKTVKQALRMNYRQTKEKK